MVDIRVVKFRAWDKDRKKMYSSEEMGKDELTLSVDGRGFVNVNGISTKLSEYFEHLIPLQWIGLLDKNNKEIYEGDIVNIVDYGNYEVIFELGSFDLVKTNEDKIDLEVVDKVRDVHAIQDFCHGTHYLEVVGNIFENPELIRHGN